MIEKEDYLEELEIPAAIPYCWICDAKMIMHTGDVLDRVWFHCPECSKLLDRIDEKISIEREKTEAILEQLEKVSHLYNSLQDHLKALLT